MSASTIWISVILISALAAALAAVIRSNRRDRARFEESLRRRRMEDEELDKKP